MFSLLLKELFSGPLTHILFEKRVSFRCETDVVYAIVSHEKTQSNRLGCFQTCCISKGSLFRLFRDHNTCRCVVWRPWRSVPVYQCGGVSFTFSGPLWDCRVQHFILEQRFVQHGARRQEGCRICLCFSWTDLIKPRLLFSKFGYCIFKWSLFRLSKALRRTH